MASIFQETFNDDFAKLCFFMMIKQIKGIIASVITVVTAAPDAPYSGINHRFSSTLSISPKNVITK